MRIRATVAVLALLLFYMSSPAFAQNKKTTKKEKPVETELVEPPPPPPAEVRAIPDDTAAFALDTDAMENMFLSQIDTTSPPADELTAELRKLLTVTGAVNLGVQFAKGLYNPESEESKILPKEFFDRMYAEMTTGSSAKLFENIMIKAYRKYFTLEDAKAMTSFYNTEIGKKTLLIMPSLLAECQAKGADVGRLIGIRVYNQLVKEGVIKYK